MKRTVSRELEIIDEKISTFPETFALRAFAGKRFRIASHFACFMLEDSVQLVVQIEKQPGVWQDFWRGDSEELRGEIR